MKKTSKAMRVACALAIATAMSTCVVAGTLAKYTTSAGGADTASVAKWGVKVTATGNAFATEYENGDAGVTVKYSGTDGKKVVAPGTTGTFEGTKISGSPEVKVHIKNVGSVSLSDNWKDSSGAYYCPIVFTIGEKEYKVTSESELETINAALTSESDVSVGTSLSGGVPQVTWTWAFDDAQTTGANDEKDNALGNKANEGTAPTVTISASTIVTQID